MTVILYRNNSDRRKINKVITELQTINVVLKSDTDITRPEIELDTASLPPEANYCYIAAFSRYYFINSQNITRGKDLKITLEIDVLMSWKDVINNTTVIASRSSNKGNKQLPDDIPLLAKRNVIYKRLTGGITASGKFGSDRVDSTVASILLTVINARGETPGTPILNEPVITSLMVSLSWEAIEGATKYYIYRKDPGTDDFQIVGQPAAQLYDDTVGSAGTYLYKIRAFKDNALSGFSNTISATVEG